MIGGISTGGLIAVMLGRLRISVEQCKQAYMHLSNTAFTKNNLVARLRNVATIGPQFQTEPLEDAIKSIVGNDWETALMKDDRTSSRDEGRGCLVLYTMRTWQACRATSAALTFFEPITIEGDIFSDGSMFYNNRVKQVHGEACEMFPGRKQILISLGTGIGELQNFEPSLTTIAQQLGDCANETERLAKNYYRRDGNRAARAREYIRFTVPRLGDVGLEEAAKLPHIRRSTEHYLEA